MIQLPKLTWQCDCEPIGYPGLVVEFWLNPPALSDDEAKRLGAGDIYEALARIVERVIVPAEYGGPTEVPGTAEALRGLDRAAGFDPQVLVWASGRYRAERGERLEVERKN